MQISINEHVVTRDGGTNLDDTFSVLFRGHDDVRLSITDGQGEYTARIYVDENTLGKIIALLERVEETMRTLGGNQLWDTLLERGQTADYVEYSKEEGGQS